ncbi:MAG: VTT domain-containing protein [Ignavibacteriales bacterium]|nr:VTT domain-containing protein [Ignavibacteriales bacterium]
MLYTIIASNISSTIAFYVGHFFGEGLLKDDGSDGWIQRYARRMRENSFETVMVMRFIFLPYDAVSYLAGFLKIHYWAFILATALGSIPGTIAFVGFGASIESFDGATAEIESCDAGFFGGDLHCKHCTFADVQEAGDDGVKRLLTFESQQEVKSRETFAS